jgi:hypothetical protein
MARPDSGIHWKASHGMSDSAEEIGIVDQSRPWLGLASFSEETRAFFHGRDEEVAELARRVQRKLLTVLFGQSGLGKTSILRAGIVPRLRSQGYCPVYVRIDYGPAAPTPSDQVRQALAQAGHWSGPNPEPGESLWELLHRRGESLLDADGKPVIPLLIFDQFEEIFTLAQGDDGGRARAAQFVEDLAELVENRPPPALEARLEIDDSVVERLDFGRADYRVLIALREDYLAHLEGLKGSMPSITQNRMRLAPMTGQQALAAVRGPGAALVSDEVAGAIVRFVAGGAEVAHAQVEPSLLSLICRELNDARIAAGRSEISLDLLAGSHASILADFYERALADQPPAVRAVVEDLLLTASGYRENVAEERVQKALAAAGAAPGALAELVNRRLLRIEERLDVRRVELTHDVLCSVVRASRDLRQEREAREASERELQERQGREQAARRSLRRMRQAAVASVALAVCALAASGYAYHSTQRAKAAAQSARATRIATDQARSEAEKLTAYLLDDFSRELDGTSRQEVFLALGKQVLQYYDALSEIKPGSDTELYRTLAQVTYGTTLEKQSRLTEAEPVLAAAVKVFEKRVQAAPNEQNSLGLARALLARAELGLSLGRAEALLDDAARARDQLQPLMEKPQPATAVRRAFAKALQTLAEMHLPKREVDKAAAEFTRARQIYAGMRALDLTDIADSLAYADATSSLAYVSYRQGRPAAAAALSQESFVLADKILALRPDHLVALRMRAGAREMSQRVAFDAGRLRAALVDQNRALADYGRILQLDPSNTHVFENYIDARWTAGSLLYDMGKMEQWQRILEDIELRIRDFGKHDGRTDNAGLQIAVELAENDNQRGRQVAARTQLANARGMYDKTFSHTEDGLRDFYRGIIVSQAAGLALSDGRPAEAVAMLRAEIETARRSQFAQEVVLVEWRHWLMFFEGKALYEQGDYPASEKMLREVVAFRERATTYRNASARRQSARFSAAHAMALAALGRHAEARTVLQPAIELWRAEQRSGSERVRVNYDLANALMVQAMASDGLARAAALAEASGLLARLPGELQQMRDVRDCRERIARLGAAGVQP